MSTVLISSDNTVYEYTLTGTFINSFTIPDNPDNEQARDLVVDRDGNIQLFNGTFDPFLSTYDFQNNTWSHQTYTDWAIVNNGSYGGIATYQNYVYLSDMLEDTEGIIRVDLDDGSAQRLTTDGDFIDLSIGLDNKLYALEGNSVDIYDPLTLEKLDSFRLSHSGGARAIAANAEGDMFFADWDGQLHHYNSDQTLVQTVDSNLSNLVDIDIASDGTIITSERFGLILVTDETFSDRTVFRADNKNTFVTFRHQPSSEGEGNNEGQEPEFTGEISGIYWIDGDRDGIQDSDEQVQSRQIVYLDLNNNQQQDDNEPSTLTDDQGGYAFTGLEDGTYTVVFEGAATPNVVPNGTESVLIPVTNYRDLIYDADDELLYITTDDGDIERFALTSQQLLAPLDIGVRLNGGDITEDGDFLFVAEETTTSDQGKIYKVNLETNAVQPLPYDLEFYEGGAWDVSLAADGTGFVSTLFKGSGWTPIREFNTTTGTLTIRDEAGSGHSGARGNTRIHRSGDRSALFFTEPNISSGPMFVYDANSDSFPVDGETDEFLGNVGAVNRNGSIFALPINNDIRLYDSNLFVLDTLDVNGRIAFDPTQDILYVADTNVDQVIAFDTTSRDELYRFNVAGGVADIAPRTTFDQGMAVSDDGQFLFVPTSAGIRAYEVGDYRLNRQSVIVSTNTPADADPNAGIFQGAQPPTSIPSLDYYFTSSSRREGSEIDLTVVFVDDEAAQNHIMTIDWGDGMVEEIELEEGARRLSAYPHVYTQDGTYTRTVTINNGDHEAVLNQSEIEIWNAVPTLDYQGELTVVEDEPYSLVLSATDAGDDDITFTVDWGDRTLETFEEDGEHQHVYTEPGDYDVMITANDGTDTVEKTFSIVVSDAPDVPDPEMPEDPDPEMPEDPDPEMPEDPDPEMPEDPDPEMPEDPDPEMPEDPDPEMPEDPDPEMPEDPDPEMPEDPDPEMPEDPDPASSDSSGSTSPEEVGSESFDVNDSGNGTLTDNDSDTPSTTPTTRPPQPRPSLPLNDLPLQETVLEEATSSQNPIGKIIFTGEAATKPAPIQFNQGRKGMNQRGGTQGDRLKGSAQNDVFNGLKGNDRLRGNGGNDKLNGGSGDDILLGGSGNDKLIGGKGDDVLKGGKGDDYLLGSKDGDRLLGGTGNDLLSGGKGDDVLTGGSGQDIFKYKRLKEGGDTITDFDPQSDLLDLSGIFMKNNYAASTAAEQLNQFVQLIQMGSSTEIQIDVDGSGDRSKMMTLATLNNVSATSLETRHFILG